MAAKTKTVRLGKRERNLLVAVFSTAINSQEDYCQCVANNPKTLASAQRDLRRFRQLREKLVGDMRTALEIVLDECTETIDVRELLRPVPKLVPKSEERT